MFIILIVFTTSIYIIVNLYYMIQDNITWRNVELYNLKYNKLISNYIKYKQRKLIRNKISSNIINSTFDYEYLETIANNNYHQQFFRTRKEPKGQQIVDEFLDINVNYPCLYGTIPVGDESKASVKDGHKYLCGYHNILGSPIVYSFGSNRNQIFEIALLKLRPDSKIYIFDVSDDKLPHLRHRDDRISYFQYGLGGHSNKTSNMKTLKEIMNLNQHKYIDVLKMDIEAAEYDWLKYESNLIPRIGQLSIELHVNNKVRYWYPPLEAKVATTFVREIEEHGLRLFYMEINRMMQSCCSEFSFIQSKFKQFEKMKNNFTSISEIQS